MLRKIVWLSTGSRSAMKVTMAAMLTRKVRVYSMKVIPALTLTAQPPNSSSLRPLPPLPSVTQRITSRYMADTAATVKITSQMLAPNVTAATPATTINCKNGPKTYRGEVAGSPPPARAPSNELDNFLETGAAILYLFFLGRVNGFLPQVGRKQRLEIVTFGTGREIL